MPEMCSMCICYHVATIRDSILFDMQHDHVLKKLNSDLLNPSPGSDTSVCMRNFNKNIENWPSYCEI